MTREQFEKLPLRFVCHMNMEDEHCITYKAYTFIGDLFVCVHQPYEDGNPKGRKITHYELNGKIYKSLDKLMQAMGGGER